MILHGHTSQPTYAIGWSSIKPIIASGDNKGTILLWNLDQFITAQKGFNIETQAQSTSAIINSNFEGKITRHSKKIERVKNTKKDTASAQSDHDKLLS